MSKRKPGPLPGKIYRAPKRYVITTGELASHVPAAPERTAYKTKGWDYSFQVWPNEPALRTTIDIQSRRGSRTGDWRAWIDSPMGRRYLASLFVLRPDAPAGWTRGQLPGSGSAIAAWHHTSDENWYTDDMIIRCLRGGGYIDERRTELVRSSFSLVEKKTEIAL